MKTFYLSTLSFKRGDLSRTMEINNERTVSDRVPFVLYGKLQTIRKTVCHSYGVQVLFRGELISQLFYF